MTSWDYYITIEHTTVSFTLARKNASNYEFVNLAIAGTSFDHVDKCKQVYQAIVSIVNDDKITDIMTKCKAAVSVTEREHALLLIRACVQYGSKNLTSMMVKHYNLNANERLRVLELANATGHVLIRRAVFDDITGVYECGAAKVTYTIAFGDAVAPTFVYEGKDTGDMMACIEFARELSNVCKGSITTNPEIVDLSKLVRAYMAPGRKEDACAHASTAAPALATPTVGADPSWRRFVIGCDGSTHAVSVATDGVYHCFAPKNTNIVNMLDELRRGGDIMPHIKSDMATWYAIACYIGYKDYAESMRWRQFDINVGSSKYTVAFDRSGWDWKPVGEVSDEVNTKCNQIIAKEQTHQCSCNNCKQPVSEYNRIYTWVHKADVVGIDKAERDALIADRNRWH